MSKKGRKPAALKPEDNIAKRLAEFIDVQKISDYSEKISIDPSEFRRVIQGKVKANYEKWAKILESVGENAVRNAAYILTGRADLKYSVQPIKLPDITPEDFREIPFYPDEVAAGQPLEVRDSPEGIVIVHKDWCKQTKHMVAVRVSSTGTSMEPTIPAGAIVTIDTTPIEPKLLLGKPVAIYKKDDGTTIKRLAQTTKGWCGIPDNRDPIHQVIMIEDGDRIIGKVNSVHYAL